MALLLSRDCGLRMRTGIVTPDWTKGPSTNSRTRAGFRSLNLVSSLHDPSRSGMQEKLLILLSSVGDAEAFHLEAFTLEDISGLTNSAMESLHLE